MCFKSTGMLTVKVVPLPIIDKPDKKRRGGFTLPSFFQVSRKSLCNIPHDKPPVLILGKIIPVTVAM